jgi:biopolymer transport protein ExbB
MRYIVFVLVVWFGLYQPAYAENANLDQLLQQIRKSQNLQDPGDKILNARYLAQKDKLRLLKEMDDQVSRLKKKSQALTAKMKANEKRLAELEADLDERAADFGELFAVVRQVAGDTKASFTHSLLTGQYPGRIKALETIAEGRALPNIAQMEALWYALQQDMTESGKVVRFSAQIDTASGEHRDADVVRIGPFVAVANGRYLNYLPEIGRLVEFARQPATRYLDLAEELEQARSGLVKAAIDPTSGVILGVLGRAPDLIERIEQGGIIGYIILFFGAVGLVIVVVRIVNLSVVNKKVQNQLNHLEDPRTDNPLGRVLTAARTQEYHDTETLELIVDDAVVREVPAMEKGQSLVKLLAAVAPLLGLLGTVTGMIETFQAISLFGTGDPKLMAGGISQALMTTLLGLTVAIPLLFLHSLMVTRSTALVQILDEQSAGLISRVAEKSRP